MSGFFEFTPTDLAFVLSHREARLGVAVQLCSLRWLGFVPDDLSELPRPALLSLCEQLKTDPDACGWTRVSRGLASVIWCAS